MATKKMVSNYRKIDKKTRDKYFKDTETEKKAKDKVGRAKGSPRPTAQAVRRRHK